MSTSFFNNNCKDDAEEIESAKNYADLARDWAIKLDGQVDGIDFSAKFWALQAATSSASKIVIEDDGVPLGSDFNVLNFGVGISVLQTAANEVQIQASGDVFSEIFVDGVDYTAGTSTDIVLTDAPVSEKNIDIYFDGLRQQTDTYDVSGTMVTFNTAIPVGVGSIEVKRPRTLDVGVATAQNILYGATGVTADNFFDQALLTFDNKASMVATLWLIAGMKVRTLGFTTAGDKGQNEYDIGTFGTADGVLIIDLDNGLQAQRIHKVELEADDVQEVKDAPFLYLGDSATFIGYTTPGDGGGNSGDIVAAGTGTDDGGSFIDLPGSGLQFRAVPIEKQFSIEQYGITGSGSESSAKVGNAISANVDKDAYFQRVDYDLSVPFVASAPVNVVGAGDVALVGKGSIDAVRTYVAPPGSAPDFSFLGDDVQTRHLSQFSKTSSPKVVQFGSSSSTYFSNDTLTQVGTFSAYIQKKLEEQNPGKTITFVNRAIPGQTWVEGNSIPTIFPSWYTDTMKPWIDYIEDEAPDLIICHLGANDAEDLSVSNMIAAIAKLEAFSKKPDIIIATHFVPSVESTPRRSWSDQEGSDTASSWLRSFAKRRDYGLIDVGRVSNIVRDGFDPLRLIYSGEIAGVDLNSEYIVTGDLAHGYAVRLNLNSDLLYTNAQPFQFSIGRRSSGAVDFCRIVDSGVAPGTIQLRVVVSGRSDQVIETGITFPTGAHVLEFATEGNQIFVKVGTTGDELMHIANVESFGGRYRVEFGFSGGGGPSGFYRYYKGEPVTSVCEISDFSEFGGFSSGAFDQLEPYGGNGVNHMSSIGAQHIAWKAVQGVNLSCETPNPSKEEDRVTTFRLVGGQTLTSGSIATVLFTTPLKNGLNLVLDVSSELTILESGIYSVTSSVRFINNSTAGRRRIVLNYGTETIASSSAYNDAAALDNYLSAGATTYLEAGDKVYLEALQNSGVNQSLANGSETYLTITKLS